MYFESYSIILQKPLFNVHFLLLYYYMYYYCIILPIARTIEIDRGLLSRWKNAHWIYNYMALRPYLKISFSWPVV